MHRVVDGFTHRCNIGGTSSFAFESGKAGNTGTDIDLAEFHELFIHADRILVIADLQKEQHRSWVDDKRIQSGIRSLLVLPLSYQGNIIGAMDLGSPKPNDFGHVDAWLAEEIMPLFAVALKRGLVDLDSAGTH